MRYSRIYITYLSLSFVSSVRPEPVEGFRRFQNVSMTNLTKGNLAGEIPQDMLNTNGLSGLRAPDTYRQFVGKIAESGPIAPRLCPSLDAIAY